MTTPHPFALPRPENATLFVIDVQERLLPAMPEAEQPALLKHVSNLVALFADAAGHIVYSEQYPKGLGPTVPALATLLTTTPATRLEKVEFSACAAPDYEALAASVARDVVLVGMETHVCVLQTGLDLIARGHRVWVPLDAVASRRAACRENGLALLERAGAVTVNTESLVFQSLGRAGTERFKRFSALVR